MVIETIGSPAVRNPTMAFLATYVWLNMGAPVPFAGYLRVPKWFMTDRHTELHRQAVRKKPKISQQPTMETVMETVVAKLHLPGANIPTNDIFGVPNTLSFSPPRQPLAWSGPADRTAYACRSQFLGSSPTSPLLSLLSLLLLVVLAVYHLTTRRTITKLKQELAEAKAKVEACNHGMDSVNHSMGSVNHRLDSLNVSVDGLISHLDAEMRRLGIVHPPKQQPPHKDEEDMASEESIAVAPLTDTAPPPSLLTVPDTPPVDELLDSAPALSDDNTGSGSEHGGPDGEDGEFGGEAGVAAGTKKKRRNNKKPRAVRRAAAAAREAAAAEESDK